MNTLLRHHEDIKIISRVLFAPVAPVRIAWTPPVAAPNVRRASSAVVAMLQAGVYIFT